jgi:hypothetical protein
MGCEWNMPGNYGTGFDTCQGTSGEVSLISDVFSYRRPADALLHSLWEYTADRHGSKANRTPLQLNPRHQHQTARQPRQSVTVPPQPMQLHL